MAAMSGDREFGRPFWTALAAIDEQRVGLA
jgi:hypothetical protein